MKKVYFLLLGLFLFSGVNAQIINFPDPILKAKLLEANYNLYQNVRDLNDNYISIDTNRDNEIEVSEALNVSFINIGANIYTNVPEDVYSMEGIQYFTNLKYLGAGYNKFSTFDASSLVNLIHLYVGPNDQLSNLNITGLTNLKKLGYNYCQQLINFNPSEFTTLEELYCEGNLLSSLDISSLKNLTTLNCSGNQLTSLDVSELINLYTLECGNNQISSIDLTKLIHLGNLKCQNNPLLSSIYMKNGSNETGLDFSNNPNLEFICADESQIISVQNKIISYGYTNCNVNSYCSFVPGGIYYTIKGNNRFDNNNNGCDLTDINFPSLKFFVTNGSLNGTVISNNIGDYTIPVVAGTHIITPILENPTYFNVSPTSTTVTFPTQASPFTQDFCITANGVHPDLEITLLPTNPARPGFDANYKIIYKNKGTNTQSGSVNLTFDDAVLDFVSANPVTTNQTVNNLSWDFTNLLPFETREISLTLNVNSPMETPAVNSGDILNYTTTITSPATDDTPNDNTTVFHQTLVNSLDPNDKTCLEGTTITPSMVGEYVHYVIRFENTGTFPAENIVVKDMIDLAKFDINTLVPIKGSHEFVTNITSGNKVEFIFENINLPFDDANNDGFVAFKIKTKANLVIGNTFSNSANIYFDYNFPIVTNTYTTTVQALGKQDFDFAKYFTVYPNPASSSLNLDVKNGIVVNSIAIYNMLGQLVIAVPNAQSVSNIDVSNLKTGNYFIKMTTDKGTSNTKFIKN